METHAFVIPPYRQWDMDSGLKKKKKKKPLRSMHTAAVVHTRMHSFNFPCVQKKGDTIIQIHKSFSASLRNATLNKSSCLKERKKKISSRHSLSQLSHMQKAN